MTDLVFDGTGERYYETGVAHAILFPHTGGAYVWNGFTGVTVDPSGGEAEHLYFDGVKTMDRVLAEEFQASLQVINTPRAFDQCEGVVQVVPGMKTHFNRRIKFNLVWITRIGNDENPDLAFKIHIAYNCLAQPSGRSFQTIQEKGTPESRSIVITTTPACGPHSYYTFDSRDADLTALWNQLIVGTLPVCSALPALVGTIVPDEELECISIITDLEEYNPGQLLDEDVEIDETEVFIHGMINNGLDIIELPADGAYEVNDSAATVVGSGNVLADVDDATYITSAEGDLGYTVELPLMTGGYSVGATFQLQIRMSITGGINPDDPDNMNAEAQVHISTDADGELTIGGFSDGAQEGMAFKLSDVEGEIVDYVIPLKMDAWINSDIADVVAALKTSAYLNFLGASNFNPDADLLPVEVRVYEATVVMMNSTDGGRYLRADPTDDVGYIEQHIHTAPGGSTDETTAFTTLVDFKIKDIPYDAAADGEDKAVVSFDDGVPGTLTAEMVVGVPTLSWYDDGSVDPDVSFAMVYATWYRVRIYWTYGAANIKVWSKNEPTIYLIDRTVIPSDAPSAQIKHYAGKVGNTEVTFEVVLDDARMLANCLEPAPVGPFELTLIPTQAGIEGAGGKSHNPMVVASDAISFGTVSFTAWVDGDDASYVWNDWQWSSKGVYPLWTTVDPDTDPTWLPVVGHTIDPAWVYQIGVKFRAKGQAGENFILQLMGNVSKLLSQTSYGAAGTLTFAASDTWEDFEVIIGSDEYDTSGWAPSGMASALAITSYLYCRTVPTDATGLLGDDHYIQIAEQRIVLYYDI